jgi:hypothetical protein
MEIHMLQGKYNVLKKEAEELERQMGNVGV